MTFPVTEHTVKSARHTTGYLACGAEKAPLLIFVHGWPELSLSWRHQLPAFAALGFRCIAPDMRGYGRSSTYTRHADFKQEAIVADMRELLAALGRDRAVWIGQLKEITAQLRQAQTVVEPPIRAGAARLLDFRGIENTHLIARGQRLVRPREVGLQILE